MGQDGLCHKEHSTDIEIVDVREVFGSDVLKTFDKIRAGVVNENGYFWAKRRLGSSYNLCWRVQEAEIRLNLDSF